MAKGRQRKAVRLAQYESATYKALQKRLAHNLRQVRTEKALTQEAAAHESDLSVRLLQRVEHQDVNLTLTTLARLCEGLNVDVVRLVSPLRK